MSRAVLELEAGTLEPGESVRMVCPFCGGGDDKEKCLSLTHREDGTLLYHCYRARCGAGGALGLGPRLRAGLARVGTALERRSSRVKENIEPRLDYLPMGWTFWGINDDELHRAGVAWDPDTSRLALPVYDPRYLLRGRVLRARPDDNRTPKALTWMYQEGPSLAWNRVDGTVTVVVEDIPSALKLATLGFRAVALNGTHMTDDAVAELDRNSTSVIWALDRDAVGKALAMDKQYRLLFKRTAVMLLDRDFKDQNAEEVNKCLYEIYLGLS